MHRGGRSSTGHDAAHHGMMLSVVQLSQQRGGSRRPTDDNVPVSPSNHGGHSAATSVLSFNRSSLITGRTPLTHDTVTRRPYGPSCGRCYIYSHSLITLLASQLTTTRNTSRRRSIAFAHRQRHHCHPQSTSVTFLSYFLPGGRQPSKK